MTARKTTVRVVGPLASHKMADAITAAGVRSTYQKDIERILGEIAARCSEPLLFALAEVPIGWPVRGNLFVTGDDGRRWRIRRSETNRAAFKYQEVPLSRAERKESA